MAPQTDRLGRGREYWQKRAAEWSTEMLNRALEYERLRHMYDQTVAIFQNTRDRREAGRLLAEVERLDKALAGAEDRLQEAREMVETTLPTEARRAGADPEWLR